MPTEFDDVRQFHRKFELAYEGPPRALLGEPLPAIAREALSEAHAVIHATREQLGAAAGLHLFRAEFLLEELLEYFDAGDAGDRAGELDALVDLVYVACGTAYLHGFDFNEAWNRVHAVNLLKVRAEVPGNSKRGSSFDVVKPFGWEPACLDDLVCPEAWLARVLRKGRIKDQEDEQC